MKQATCCVKKSESQKEGKEVRKRGEIESIILPFEHQIRWGFVKQPGHEFVIF